MSRECCETNEDGLPKCDGACIHRHACPDWDYLVITDGDPEYECCLCAAHGGKGRGTAEVQRDRMTEHFGLNAKTNPGMGD